VNSGRDYPALEPVPHSMLDEEACDDSYLAIADITHDDALYLRPFAGRGRPLPMAAAKQVVSRLRIRDVRWRLHS